MLLKIKTLYRMLLGVFVLSITINAEWDTITFKEHVAKSSLIVVAEFQKELEKKEIEVGIEQLVLFEANETIKGNINGSFIVKGQELYMCMPQMLFPNIPKVKYLLFLNQEGNSSTYNLVHGKRSALVIENGSVGWIEDKEKIDMGEPVSISFDKVRKEIDEVK